MPAALDILHGPESYLFFINRPNVVNVHVELSATAHSTFGLGLRHGCNRRGPTRNDYRIANLDFIKNFKIHCLPNGRIGGRDSPIEPHPNRRCVVQHQGIVLGRHENRTR
jgi:hypothetical protein